MTMDQCQEQEELTPDGEIVQVRHVREAGKLVGHNKG